MAGATVPPDLDTPENREILKKVESTLGKIKTMKRQAYGYRCDEFLTLKLYSLHDKRVRI